MSEPEPSTNERPRAPDGNHPRRRLIAGRPFQFARMLIVNQHLRRQTMFYTVLAAMLMAFVGDVILSRWLYEKLARFVAWWLICGCLTVLAALLAMYDLLLLRLQHRLVRRELRERLLKQSEEDL